MKRFFTCPLRMRCFMLLLLLVLGMRSKAQTAASYGFTSSSGTYTAISGGTLLSSGTSMDDARFSVTIPSFTYLGVAYTTVWASENGYIQFGTTAPTTSMRSYLSSTETAALSGVSAFSRDLAGRATASLRTQTIGSEVIFQWANMTNFASTAQTYTFQIRLNTVTGEIRVVYNTMSSTTSSPGQVGLRGSRTDFNNRTSTTSWAASIAGTVNTATMGLTSTVFPSSGLNYIWNPPPPCSSRPAGGIAVSSAGTTPICAGTSATLSVTGSSAGLTGLSYAWDSSLSAAGPWSAIPGATATTYAASPGACANVFYRRRTICAAVGLFDTSRSVAVSARCALVPPYLETFESITAINTYPNCMTATARVESRLAPSGFANQINRTPGGSKYASFLWSANDWIFTPAIQLTAGSLYEFSFWYITDGVAGWDSLTVNFGAAPNAASMVNRISPRLSNLTNTTYRKYSVRFTATTTGVVYFGINCISKVAPNRLTIDDIGLQEVLPCAGPPATGTPSSSVSRICSSGSVELDLPTLPPALGLIYEWQDSTVGGTWGSGGGRPTSGGTTLPFTTDVFSKTTYFRCIVKCTLTGDSTISPAIMVPAGPYEMPYFENFESIEIPNRLPACMSATNLGSFVNSALTPSTLGRGNNTPGGSKYAFFRWSCNDYLFTPSINLTAGIQYIFSFWYLTDGNTGWTTLNVRYGADATAAAMTTTLKTVNNARNTSFVQYRDTFTVTRTGTYNFGIYCNATGVPWYLSVDDIGVNYRPCFSKPTAGAIDGSIPSGKGLCPNTSVSIFCLGATTRGIGGIAYQWQRAVSGTTVWSNIPGATDSLISGDTLMGYDYRLRVLCANTRDTVYSGTFSVPALTPHPPVAITPSASPIVFCLGDTVKLLANNFSAAVYDWERDGVLIPGWKFNDLGASLPGTYRVTVRSPLSLCPATSEAVLLKQIDPGFAVTLLTPADSFACEGNAVVLNGSASKSGVRYQWRRNNVDIPGATFATYAATSSGVYTLTADDGVSSCKAVSRSIPVTMLPAPVAKISVSGGVTTACENDGVRLNANPIAAFTYQWMRGGSPVVGFTDSVLVVRSSGVYTVKVRSKDGCVSVSDPIRVTILPSPKPIISRTGLVLQSVFPFPAYEWYRNGALLVGRNADTLRLTQKGNYQLKVKDSTNCEGVSNTIYVGDESLAIDESAAVATMRLFPNPTSGVLNIECPVPFVAELKDVVGRTLMSGITGTHVDLSSLPDGVYLLLVQNPDGSIRTQQRVMKSSR